MSTDGIPNVGGNEACNKRERGVDRRVRNSVERTGRGYGSVGATDECITCWNLDPRQELHQARAVVPAVILSQTVLQTHVPLVEALHLTQSVVGGPHKGPVLRLQHVLLDLGGHIAPKLVRVPIQGRQKVKVQNAFSPPSTQDNHCP